MIRVRIHGDNILECERALKLVATSLESKLKYADSPIYAPVYNLTTGNKIIGNGQLFPGYDKWGISIQEILKKRGSPLREATDAIVTILTNNNEEEILFSIEFCNALPAGNNAWQRTGRALACASVNIPYLHLSEIGGVELGDERQLKAHRFPNPIIPFSYITLGKNYDSLTIPIYVPSPSSPPEIRKQFSKTFGIGDGIKLIRNIILKEDTDKIVESVIKKNLELVNLLSIKRKRKDTLRNSEWKDFLEISTVKERLKWLENKNMSWVKKSSKKVSTTKTLRNLLSFVKEINSLSIGAEDIPICLIPSDLRVKLSKAIIRLYGDKIDKSFLDWLSKNNSSLVIIWITGFKPRGDDSRPDRGLVPLARMLLGPDAEILSIVYGPAKPKMWEQLRKSPKELAEQNGLWEAIIKLSDAVLADSVTCKQSPLCLLIDRKKGTFKGKIKFTGTNIFTQFSEQDVDSVIHFLFSQSSHKQIFECMCNPPGGDWSGLSFLNFQTNEQFRWTSLPRVSKSNGKRPDHVIEIKLNKENILLLSIESKTNASKLDEGIGIRLNRYTNDLIKTLPTIKKSNSSWEFMKGKWKIDENLIYNSGGAFCYKDSRELDFILKKGQLDVIFALEFLKESKVKLHMKSSSKSNHLVEPLKDMERLLKGRLEIQIH